MEPLTLSREERLRRLGAIRRLFECGQSGYLYPFRYVWYAEADVEFSAKVMISVPKKFHKRANKRNILRRRVKEAYRLNRKEIFLESITRKLQPNCALELALIYSTKERLPYNKIENAVRKVLKEISESL